MTESKVALVPVYREDDEISLWALGSVVVRYRRLIIAFALGGAALGLVSGLTTTRVYTSNTTFLPGEGDATPSGLGGVASQLGIRSPSASGGWGAPLYVELLHSRSLLEPIVLDTVSVVERGGRPIRVIDLLGIEAPTLPRRIDLAVRTLAGMVTASEDYKLGGVRVSVTTPWPSFSLALANRLVTGVTEFNSNTRRSRAAAERQFVEGQVTEAEAALRAAESRLQDFLQRNRVTAGSPQLAFEQDRLQREVTLRQQLQTSWLRSREDARIREIRDIPVITVLEKPQLPFVGEPRKSLQKAILGALVWGALGLLIAFLAQGFRSARGATSEDAGEFFRLIDDATPRFLKKRLARGS